MEMISDGIENCLCYAHNFNPEKSNNPFAYFTQIIYFAFLRRIQKEKKQQYIKHKSLENALLNNNLVEIDDSFQQFGSTSIIEVSEKLTDLIEKIESKPNITNIAKKGIERFYDENI